MYPISKWLNPANVYSTVPQGMFLLISVESTSELHTEYFRNIFQTHIEITLQLFKVKKTLDIYEWNLKFRVIDEHNSTDLIFASESQKH